MSLRYILPVLGLLALAGCKDEKKSQADNPPGTTQPSSSNNAPENKPVPTQPVPKPN